MWRLNCVSVDVTLFLESLRFVFGAGWGMLWNIPFLLGAVMFAVGPMAMLAGDALKTPVPTASLGTIAYVMIIGSFLSLATAVGVALTMRSAAFSPGWIGLATLGSAVAMAALSFWLLGTMCSKGGRLWVSLGWILVGATLLAHLGAVYRAATRPSPAATPVLPVAPLASEP